MSDLKENIILGAVNITGPVSLDGEGKPDHQKWELDVKENVKRLTTMLSPQSQLSKTIDMLTSENTKRFPATILHIDRETKTNRGFVVFKTKPSDDNPEGIESARTEIVSGNPEAVAFARRLRGLVGHRVFVYIEVQTMKSTGAANGRKVRVLQYVEDLGEDTYLTDGDYEKGQEYFEANAKK